MLQPPEAAGDEDFTRRLVSLLQAEQKQPPSGSSAAARLQLLSLLEARLAQVSLNPQQQQQQQPQEQAALLQLVATERSKLAEDACALLGPPPRPPTANVAAEEDSSLPLLTPAALPNGCLLVSPESGNGAQELLASLLPKRGPLPPPAQVVVAFTRAPRSAQTTGAEQAPPAHAPPLQPRPHQQQHQQQRATSSSSSSSGPFPQSLMRTAGGGGPAMDQALARMQSGQQHHQPPPPPPPLAARSGPYLRSTAPPPRMHQPSPHESWESHKRQAQTFASRFATAGELRSQHQQRRKRPLGGGGGDGDPDAPPSSARGGGGGGRGRRGRYGEGEDGGGGRWYGGQQEGEEEEEDEHEHEQQQRQRQQYLEQQAGFNPRVKKKFVPPVVKGGGDSGPGGGIKAMVKRAFAGPAGGPPKRKGAAGGGGEEGGGESKELPEELKGCDPALVERIEQEIIDRGDPVSFEDISGLRFQKKAVIELVCWPLERPDLFTGLRALPKGLLLFGPPGTGKTLIGKAISSQSGATFFSISASSLTSKWIGEGEKMVRTLFKVAAYYQPTIIFIDEVDSLLCQRTSDENEATRRIKTEFLVQLDGCGSSAEDRILVVGATNRPDELDEAARRRFVKRLYIPLPDAEARSALVTLLLRKNGHALTQAEIQAVVGRTEGFSGADIKSLCTEAAMGPIRDLASKGLAGLSSLSAADVPPIAYRHFLDALASVRPSVGDKDLGKLMAWNEQFGTYPRSHQQAPQQEGEGREKENQGPQGVCGE